MNEQKIPMHSSITINMRASVCLCAVNAAKRSFFIESNENPLTAHQHVVSYFLLYHHLLNEAQPFGYNVEEQNELNQTAS